MDNSDRLGSAHHGLVKLLQNMPRERLIELVCSAVGLSPAHVAFVRERTPSVELVGLLRRARIAIADLVLSVHTISGRVLAVWIFEIQISWDVSKRWAWMVLLAAFASETRGEAKLIALCPIPATRARIRRAWARKFGEQLVLFGPDQITRIDDIQLAKQYPHDTILAAILHSRTEVPEHLRVAGIRAGLLALWTLDLDERRQYAIPMMSLIPESLFQQAVDELAARGALPDDHEQLFAEAEREGYSFNHGLREGRIEGRIETLRRVIFDTHELLGLELDAAARARIETCTCVDTLDAWYADVRRRIRRA